MRTPVVPQLSGSLPNAVFSGLINGGMQIPLCIALAAVIFSGQMKVYLPLGIGLFLIGNAIVSAIVSLHSSSRYGLATVQDSTPAIIALMVAGMASSVHRQASGLPTVITAITLSTLAIGLTFYGLGFFRMGVVARYFPPSVVNGYLAGTGIILLLAGLGFLLDRSLMISDLPQLFSAEALLRWMPGAVFGIVLTALHLRFARAWVLPLVLFTTAVAFSLTLIGFQISLQEAVARGWLQAGGSTSRLWPPLQLAQLAEVEWSVLGQHVFHYVIIAFVGSLALLLNVTALEQATEEELDLDRELRINGLANLIAGLFGGANGYLSISGSSLSHELKAPGRLPSLINASMSIAALCFGVSILQIFPNFLLGGLTIFLGISMLKEPVWDNFQRFSRLEFAVTIMVAVAIACFGFVIGVVAGLVVSSLFFVVSTSRVNSIRYVATCSSIHSQKLRSRSAAAQLRLRGHAAVIIALQGALFFGSAFQFYRHLQQILGVQDTRRPRYLLLDFKDVYCIDSGGFTWISRLARLLDRERLTLVLSGLPAVTQRQLLRFLGGRPASDHDLLHGIHLAADLDEALQWCEERLLVPLAADPAASAEDQPEAALSSERLHSLDAQDDAALQWTSSFIARAGTYLRREVHAAGAVLWRADDDADRFYFVLAGEVIFSSLSASGQEKDYFTVGPGSFIGETSFFTAQQRLGTVTAGSDSILYALTRASLERLSAERPDLALELERHVLSVEALIVSEGLHSIDFMLG